MKTKIWLEKIKVKKYTFSWKSQKLTCENNKKMAICCIPFKNNIKKWTFLWVTISIRALRARSLSSDSSPFSGSKRKREIKLQSPDQLFPKTESLPRPVPVELSPRKDLSFPIESICKPCTGAFFLVLPRGLSVTNTDHFSREKVKQSSQSFRGKPNSVGEEATMFAPIFRLLVCSVARNKRKPDCGGRCTFVRLGTWLWRVEGV